MAIRIEIKGLEELQRKLEVLQEGLTLQGLQHWAKEIEDEAKDLSAPTLPRDAKDSMRIQVFEIKPKRFRVRAGAKKEALSFMADATRDKLPQMPSTSQPIFRAFLREIEKNLQKR